MAEKVEFIGKKKGFTSDEKVESLSKEVKFRRLKGNENVLSHCYSWWYEKNS